MAVIIILAMLCTPFMFASALLASRTFQTYSLARIPLKFRARLEEHVQWEVMRLFKIFRRQE